MPKGAYHGQANNVTPQVLGASWLAKNDANRANMLRAFAQRNPPEGMRRLLLDTLLPGGDLGDELRALRHPTLVLRGAEDFVVPRALNDELVSLIPGARYAECPDSGHTVAIEQPEWFTARVEEFLLAE